ncbi:N-acetylmuramidase domain-containing protein [Pseudomonas putida]|uniref:DUF3380 domain-containing protein n=1 Tax=Pseudomonas putida TaxID=303 RepID=A0A6I6XVS5_PSEPU|nr:N-acetylmuramidase domain-containing protein [Pseudomonas putida]QHG64382.1 DUF3380 domain-containing protein [Pseudomonas putida]
MSFQGKGSPLSDEGMNEVCDSLGVSESEIWAVLTVETRGFGFLSDRRPQILFERHVFHRLTQGLYDGNPDISRSKAGGYVGGAGEYARLETAMQLDKTAALQSASWGIGQVMGFNFKVAGFTSTDKLVAAMVKDENSQLQAMAHFIMGNNLAGALQRNNWVSFARSYNDADFKRNEYDTRLAAAHAKFKVTLPDLNLRTAQAALQYLGMDPGPIDGIRGRRTFSALIRFQESEGLAETGLLDQDTLERLVEKAVA